VASVISANKGSRPCYEKETVAPRIGETPMQRLRRLHAAHQLEARQFDLFHTRAGEPHCLQSPKEACETVVNLMARILSSRRSAGSNALSICWETYEAILDACCDAWNALMAKSNVITSIGTREWAQVRI
jgi:hypothetical protein